MEQKYCSAVVFKVRRNVKSQTSTFLRPFSHQLLFPYYYEHSKPNLHDLFLWIWDFFSSKTIARFRTKNARACAKQDFMPLCKSKSANQHFKCGRINYQYRYIVPVRFLKTSTSIVASEYFLKYLLQLTPVTYSFPVNPLLGTI